ncbi:MAG: hypothetical protein H6Q73_609 [Firmicutes bacterium]|nr:hypothetical protein [Bacillota bacterium]
MDIRQLRNFISVAEHLNFSAAAKDLHISQPALSKQITDLESQTGLQLFIRNTRNVELTSAGAALFEKSLAIVARSDAAINKARLASQGSVGRLHIGYLGSFENKLPELIRKFRISFPNCDITFSQFNWGLLNQALEDGNLDIAFTPSYGLEGLSGVSWKLGYHSYSLTAIVPQEHPLATKESVPLSAFAHEPFVVLSRQECPLAYNHMRQLCKASGFTPNIVGIAPILETLLLMVATGMGITIHSKLVSSYGICNLHYLDLEDCPFTFNMAVAWKSTNSNPLIPLFLNTFDKEYCLV